MEKSLVFIFLFSFVAQTMLIVLAFRPIIDVVRFFAIGVKHRGTSLEQRHKRVIARMNLIG